MFGLFKKRKAPKNEAVIDLCKLSNLSETEKKETTNETDAEFLSTLAAAASSSDTTRNVDIERLERLDRRLDRLIERFELLERKIERLEARIELKY